MKKFKKHFEEDAPGTSTASVVGTGDDSSTVVVRKKKKRKKDDVLTRGVDPLKQT